MNFPSISEYNQAIRRNGGNAFRTLSGIELLPSRRKPITIYSFGTGAFATVFKGVLNNRTYALRCFLSAENDAIDRYKLICKYLSGLNSSWKTECRFLESEIYVGDQFYPILQMEWIDGLLINDFVTRNLQDNNVLSELQKKLVDVSNDLEKNQVGHGDIQCGNIIISESSTGFSIRLIDYDGMYVPALRYKNSVEKGRSEFQHPKRTLSNFNHEIDRFSFWVILTALEALKQDKTLWREVMQGGFNSLDNFLFTIQDFLNPNTSQLFNRLYEINDVDLNFYLNHLKKWCVGDYASIEKPVLSTSGTGRTWSTPQQKPDVKPTRPQILRDDTFQPKYHILTPNCTASVLSSAFQRIGSTPIQLDKKSYQGKTIIVSNGRDTKRVTLSPHDHVIEVLLKD